MYTMCPKYAHSFVVLCFTAIMSTITSSNGNIRVTGHLRGEFTGHRWIETSRRIYDIIVMGKGKPIPQDNKWWWWRYERETFSALLALCAGNSPVNGEFPSQRPVTWSFDVFFDLCLNKRLSKQSWGWWFQTPSCPSWRHCNGDYMDFRPCYHSIFTWTVFKWWSSLY